MGDVLHNVFERSKIVLTLVAVHAVGNGHQPYIVEREKFFGQLADLNVVAPQPGQVFDEHRRDIPCLDCGQHFLKTGTLHGRSCDAIVYKENRVGVPFVLGGLLKYLPLRRDLSRYVFVKKCAIRIDKKQKERYGKKYCHHSPSIEESLLQDAVMRAIMQTAKQNVEVLKTLKIHIGMGLTDEVTEDKTLDIQIRIAEINTEFQKLLKAVSADNADGIDEERITELMNEKQRLTVQLEQYAAMRQKRESAKSRLDEIYTILDGLQNHPMEYNDKLVRQIIECIVVESKEKIKVVFIGGTEIEMTL